MGHDFQADLDAIKDIDRLPAILEAASRCAGTDFVMVARVTEEQWVCLAANNRLRPDIQPGMELKADTMICHDVHRTGASIAIDDITADATYVDHPAAALYGFRSYISVPILLSDGRIYGTLTAFGAKPARVNDPNVLGVFELFADLIAGQLETASRLISVEAGLREVRAAAQVQEDHVGALSHDLRNPLAAMAAGVRLLHRQPLNERGKAIIEMLDKSTARMTGLIDDVVTLARAHARTGPRSIPTMEPLEPVLSSLLDEFRAAHPGRPIAAAFHITKPVLADGHRIGTLLSKLMENALSYGDENTLISVQAQTYGCFSLCVTNKGPPIPPATLDRLFEPFSRGDQLGQGGVGLGLFVAAQIAGAHDGTIDVVSTDGETRFTFQMPLADTSRMALDGEPATA